MLNPFQHLLNKIPPFGRVLVMLARSLSNSSRRDHRTPDHLVCPDRFVAPRTHVGDHMLGLDVRHLRIALCHAGFRAGGGDHPDQVAHVVADDMGPGNPPPTRAVNQPVVDVLPAPAVCWRARAVIEPIGRGSRLRSRIGISMPRHQTPNLAQRLDRSGEVFYTPSRPGVGDQHAVSLDLGVGDGDDVLVAVSGGQVLLELVQASLIEGPDIPVGIGEESVEAGLVGGGGEFVVDAQEGLALGNDEAGEVFRRGGGVGSRWLRGNRIDSRRPGSAWGTR